MHRICAVLASLLTALILAALPGAAAARMAYVTGVDEVAGPAVTPVELTTETPEAPIPLGGEGSATDIAITPDGKTAYVVSPALALTPIDLATRTALPEIPGADTGFAIALSPDGRTAYVVIRFSDQLLPVDLVNGQAGSPITVGPFPMAVAVSPDELTAYVANLDDNSVTPVDLTARTTEPKIPLPQIGGNNFDPTSLAVTPDGRTLVVAGGGGGVALIDTATRTVLSTPTLPGGSLFARHVAISPDGSRAYVADSDGGRVVPVSLPDGTVLPEIPFGNSFLEDVALTPDGKNGYATDNAGLDLAPFVTASDTAGTPFPVIESPEALAIVPNQPPHAAFTASPQTAGVGQEVGFDAGASTDPDGSVARYEWDFGDGSGAAGGEAAVSHSYAKPGTYQVSLLLTDNEGCSDTLVFTGQMAYCNGSAVARATGTVTVRDNAAPCPIANGTATSFVPKIRRFRTAPGVRVRLAADQPSHLKVKATLIWSKRHAKRHAKRRTRLGRLEVNVNRWRRVRFVLPRSVRRFLPLGTRVKVRLRIDAQPLGGETCASKTTRRTLRVRVVKVIPGAVQKGRVR